MEKTIGEKMSEQIGYVSALADLAQKVLEKQQAGYLISLTLVVDLVSELRDKSKAKMLELANVKK